MTKRIGLIFTLILFSTQIFARLGGAGDDDNSSSSSSSYESSSSSSYDSDYDGGSGSDGKTGPIESWVMIIVVGVFFIYGLIQVLSEQYEKIFRKSIDKKKARISLEKSLSTKNLSDSVAQIYFGEVKEREFKEKTCKAFYELQDAWSEKTMAKSRRYLSDGIYQKFQAQLLMMDQLSLTNKLENVHMDRVNIVHHYREGDFLIIEVEVGAVISDTYRSSKYPGLNSKSYEKFTEYYTFIKKVNAKGDLYSSNNCQNCGNQLPAAMGDIARCESCGTLANSPEFDWILNEITQPKMYYKSKGAFNFPYVTFKETANSYDFCKQYLEDVASNAFVHLRMGDATNNFQKTQRYVSEKYLQKVKDLDDEPYLYHRYYISKLNLIRINYIKEESVYEAEFLVKEHFRRVRPNGQGLTSIDTKMNSQERIISMKKTVKAFSNPHLVHQHKCCNCGAPIKNTDDLNCSFCDTLLASSDADWIIDGVFSVKDA